MVVHTHLTSIYIWYNDGKIHKLSYKLIKRFLPRNISDKIVVFDALHKHNHSEWNPNYEYLTEDDTMQHLESIKLIFAETKVDMRTFGLNTLKLTNLGGKFCFKYNLAPAQEILSLMVRRSTLNLAGFDLPALPPEVTDFVNLNYLNISNNNFETLPHNFENLTNLLAIAYQETPLLLTEIARLEAMMPRYFAEKYSSDI